MRDPRLDRLADVLVRYSTKVKPGELVALSGDPSGLPFTEALFEAVIKAGGHPFYWPRMEMHNEALLAFGTDEQIAFNNPLMMDMVEKIDAIITWWSENNTKYLSRYDARKSALLQQARKPFMKRFMQRAADEGPKRLRWVGTQYPANASAQDAEMSLRQYEEFVFKAGLLHTADPVAEWEKVFKRQEQVREYLTGKKVVHFRVPPVSDGPGKNDGTDLTVDVSKATWVNCGGLENFPDGEVFAGPTLPSIGGFGVRGHVNYTFPAVYQGREVEGVRLAFKDGKVVEASARKNEEFLIKMLDQDAGARTMGEIAIGTNYGITDFSKNTLFDEKIGGTFHAAVGAGYPESGNTNESGLHWDMVCDLRNRQGLPGGVIEADGEVFHKNGKFLRAGWPGND